VLGVVLVLAGALVAPAAARLPLDKADSRFAESVVKGDAGGVASLLDPGCTWTDVNGQTFDARGVLKVLPKPSIMREARTNRREYEYGRIAVIEADSGKFHQLRIWVMRPAGWRLLIYQEVKSLDAPAAAAATPSVGSACENPCGAVPYAPKTATERAVMDAYKSLEEAAMGGKAREWSAIAADEIALVSSNSDRVFDKPTRAAAIAKATLGGVAPTKLLSARLFEFGDAVVMTSQHQSDRGQFIHITRVWVKRDGRWQETLSYQTAVR